MLVVQYSSDSVLVLHEDVYKCTMCIDIIDSSSAILPAGSRERGDSFGVFEF